MSRRKKPLFEDIEITDLGAKAKAVGHAPDGRVIFAPYLAPGDVADIQVTKKRKAYYEGKPVQVKVFSDLRTTPVCQYFGTCGGCKLQHISYEAQLQFKQKEVINNLTRLGKVNLPKTIDPIMGSPKIYNYRNKMEFSFSAKRWLTPEEIAKKEPIEQPEGLGFHIAGMWDKVLDISECHLQQEPSNSIRNEVRDFALKHQIPFFDPRAKTGLLRTLMIRNTSIGEWMVVLQVYKNDPTAINNLLNHLKESFPQITSLQYIVNEKDNDSFYDQEVVLFHGKPYIEEKWEGLTYRISAKSFFQTNSEQALELYRKVREFANIQPHETVYDLYTGTGSIAQFVARDAEKVIGVEAVADAIEDAKKNAALNGIDNATFVVGDMKEVFTPEFIEKFGKADIVITDPPRDGMHAKVVENLLFLAPERIVYVSCNSATQARDLALMKNDYEIVKMQPVDMFPHTHHVENIVLLQKK
ncbi:MAG TPA: 23S rRNA (uracil(1939)-C(5))-methyltransferase RlmD [Flavobacteriales bacterium]|jgi:23S rRNA (uracil1939-C5)-methyltransferase|nr:23S rRNA (uracil(1939)-C(5))-methyltransferase RlmD [Flavobacteriales bacterium]